MAAAGGALQGAVVELSAVAVVPGVTDGVGGASYVITPPESDRVITGAALASGGVSARIGEPSNSSDIDIVATATDTPHQLPATSTTEELARAALVEAERRQGELRMKNLGAVIPMPPTSDSIPTLLSAANVSMASAARATSASGTATSAASSSARAPPSSGASRGGGLAKARAPPPPHLMTKWPSRVKPRPRGGLLLPTPDQVSMEAPVSTPDQVSMEAHVLPGSMGGMPLTGIVNPGASTCTGVAHAPTPARGKPFVAMLPLSEQPPSTSAAPQGVMMMPVQLSHEHMAQLLHRPPPPPSGLTEQQAAELIASMQALIHSGILRATPTPNGPAVGAAPGARVPPSAASSSSHSAPVVPPTEAGVAGGKRSRDVHREDHFQLTAADALCRQMAHSQSAPPMASTITAAPTLIITVSAGASASVDASVSVDAPASAAASASAGAPAGAREPSPRDRSNEYAAVQKAAAEAAEQAVRTAIALEATHAKRARAAPPVAASATPAVTMLTATPIMPAAHALPVDDDDPPTVAVPATACAPATAHYMVNAAPVMAEQVLPTAPSLTPTPHQLPSSSAAAEAAVAAASPSKWQDLLLGWMVEARQYTSGALVGGEVISYDATARAFTLTFANGSVESAYLPQSAVRLIEPATGERMTWSAFSQRCAARGLTIDDATLAKIVAFGEAEPPSAPPTAAQLLAQMEMSLDNHE